VTDSRACLVCLARNRPDENGDVRPPNLCDRPHACEPCRDWLAVLPGQIVALWARLGPDGAEPAGPWKVRQRRGEKWVVEDGYDPVASELPTGARGTRPYSDRVSGAAAETPVPVNLDDVDLSGRVRTSPLSSHARQWWVDQTGHLSVAMELDLIVRDWADQLTADNGHLSRLPVPTVPELAAWLTNRLDWACEHYPGIGDDARTLTRLRGTLRGVLGETEPHPERMGAPCPGCDLLTLVRRPGESKVECGNDDCRRILTAEEYGRWTGLVAAAIEHERAQEELAEQERMSA